jgi:hypothetical protein
LAAWIVGEALKNYGNKEDTAFQGSVSSGGEKMRRSAYFKITYLSSIV